MKIQTDFLRNSMFIGRVVNQVDIRSVKCNYFHQNREMAAKFYMISQNEFDEFNKGL
jgi:hypothetical protein